MLNRDIFALSSGYEPVNESKKSESTSDLDIQLFYDLDLAIKICNDLDELNHLCYQFYEHCKDTKVDIKDAIKCLSNEARQKMQKLWAYEDPLTDDEIEFELYELYRTNESKKVNEGGGSGVAFNFEIQDSMIDGYTVDIEEYDERYRFAAGQVELGSYENSVAVEDGGYFYIDRVKTLDALAKIIERNTFTYNLHPFIQQNDTKYDGVVQYEPIGVSGDINFMYSPGFSRADISDSFIPSDVNLYIEYKISGEVNGQYTRLDVDYANSPDQDAFTDSHDGEVAHTDIIMVPVIATYEPSESVKYEYRHIDDYDADECSKATESLKASYNMETNKLSIPFGNKLIDVTMTDEFKELCLDFAWQNGRPEYLPELLRVASKYNYYDAIGNDCAAGGILVNLAGTEHHDRVLKVAEELLKLDEYKAVYDDEFEKSQDARIARGKAAFGVMLDNAEEALTPADNFSNEFKEKVEAKLREYASEIIDHLDRGSIDFATLAEAEGFRVYGGRDYDSQALVLNVKGRPSLDLSKFDFTDEETFGNLVDYAIMKFVGRLEDEFEDFTIRGRMGGYWGLANLEDHVQISEIGYSKLVDEVLNIITDSSQGYKEAWDAAESDEDRLDIIERCILLEVTELADAIVDDTEYLEIEPKFIGLMTELKDAIDEEERDMQSQDYWDAI